MKRKKMEEIKVVAGKENGSKPDSRYYEFVDITYDYKDIPEFPLQDKFGMRKYLPLLPVGEIYTKLEVGNTPIVQADKFGRRCGLSRLYIKREDLNPTGCFKDRESAVVMSLAHERGYKSVYVVSSGNAALSTAKFAEELGIGCTCFVPEKTTDDKKNLITTYGASLVTLRGFYEDVYRAVVDMQPQPDGWNVTSGQNPFRIEGGKTMGWEMYEQLHQVPDTIVIPSGNGGCLAATWKAFVELKELGLTDKLPQMVCVQIKGAAPINDAFKQDKPFVVLGEIEDSVAEGIVAQESYNSPQAVRAIRDSGGYVVEVTDDEIIEALRQVVEDENILPEPTAAATFAALSKLKSAKDALIVAVNTGSGEKMKEHIKSLLAK